MCGIVGYIGTKNAKDIIEDQVWQFIFNEITWEISKKEKQEILLIQKDNNKIFLGLNKDIFLKLIKKISKDIERPARNAKFVLKNGKVNEFLNNILNKIIEKNIKTFDI